MSQGPGFVKITTMSDRSQIELTRRGQTKLNEHRAKERKGLHTRDGDTSVDHAVIK
jgi:hypothetical protein